MRVMVGLEFNGQVKAIKVMSSQSVYLTTLFLDRLIYVVLLAVNQYLSTFFPRQLTTALLELAKGTNWLKKIHDQSSQKNVTGPGRDQTCDLLISSLMCIRLSHSDRPIEVKIQSVWHNNKPYFLSGFMYNIYPKHWVVWF